MPWSDSAPHPTVICLLKVDRRIPSLPRNKGRFTYQWICWHTSQAMSARFVPLAVSLRRAPGCLPPAHPCHSWLQYANPATRTSWKRQFLQGRVGFSPKLCTLCSKRQEGSSSMATTSPAHNSGTAGRVHAPVSLPCLLCQGVAIHWAVTQLSNFTSSCEGKNVSQIPPHFIFLHHGQCVFFEHLGPPGFDQAGRC